VTREGRRQLALEIRTKDGREGIGLKYEAHPTTSVRNTVGVSGYRLRLLWTFRNVINQKEGCMDETNGPEEVSEKAKDQMAAVKEIADAAVDQARQTAQTAWQEAKRKVNVFETNVRAHPIRTVLVALGLGFILALFMRR
jgi:ElaB/YqjD/DUF883 family membrane-anchored ribosome-binding protein